MSETVSGPAVPALFGQALDAVRESTTRPELVLTEIPAPIGLAPYAIAMAGDVRPARHGVDSLLGTGRFVLLHDPEGPDAWEGTFRVVCFAQAPLETDIGLDPFVAGVAWSWLEDALSVRGRPLPLRIGHRDQGRSPPDSASSPARATGPLSSCAPRGRLTRTPSPHPSRPGANCSACSRASRRPPRRSVCSPTSERRVTEPDVLTPT